MHPTYCTEYIKIGKDRCLHGAEKRLAGRQKLIVWNKAEIIGRHVIHYRVVNHGSRSDLLDFEYMRKMI